GRAGSPGWTGRGRACTRHASHGTGEHGGAPCTTIPPQEDTEDTMGGLDGKVALVTGGSRGIGKGIARGLAHEGASVVISARPSASLEETAAELRASGATVLAVPADVTDEGQVDQLFSAAIERFGKLDVLVNNAGAFDGGPLD